MTPTKGLTMKHAVAATIAAALVSIPASAAVADEPLSSSVAIGSTVEERPQVLLDTTIEITTTGSAAPATYEVELRGFEGLGVEAAGTGTHRPPVADWDEWRTFCSRQHGLRDAAPPAIRETCQTRFLRGVHRDALLDETTNGFEIVTVGEGGASVITPGSIVLTRTTTPAGHVVSDAPIVIDVDRGDDGGLAYELTSAHPGVGLATKSTTTRGTVTLTVDTWPVQATTDSAEATALAAYASAHGDGDTMRDW